MWTINHSDRSVSIRLRIRMRWLDYGWGLSLGNTSTRNHTYLIIGNQQREAQLSTMMCVIFVELPSTGRHLVSYRIVSADCSSLPAQSAYVTKNFLTVISSGAHSDWSNSTLIREKIQLKFSTLFRKIASKLWLNTKLFRCLKVPLISEQINKW